MKMNVDANKVILRYESIIAQANREMVILNIVKEEQQEEIEQLKTQVAELQAKVNKLESE
jgi:hypothetical protein